MIATGTTFALMSGDGALQRAGGKMSAEWDKILAGAADHLFADINHSKEHNLNSHGWHYTPQRCHSPILATSYFGSARITQASHWQR